MKIALIAPVLERVPPPYYGGIERVIAELAFGLSRKGAEVTVYASGKSSLHGKSIQLKQSSSFPTRTKVQENRYWEISELLKVVAEQDQYDLLHFHYEPLVTQARIDGREFNLLEFIYKPFLITFHNQTHISQNVRFYRIHKNLWSYNYVSISRNQRQPLNFLNFVATVYNGIPVEKFTFSARPKNYLMFLGRAAPEKGIEEAIKIAKISQHQLYIAAKVDPKDQTYYRRRIRPLINNRDIKWLGEILHSKKVSYLRQAKALLFPIRWPEPFGLVMVEAMACGTPVIATNLGSTKEVIDHGKTGFLVDKTQAVKQSVKRIREIDRLNRHVVRQAVEKRFSSQIMVKNYFHLYQQILHKG